MPELSSELRRTRAAPVDQQYGPRCTDLCHGPPECVDRLGPGNKCSTDLEYGRPRHRKFQTYSRMAFWACSLNSACKRWIDRSLSMTESSTTTFRRTGRQCMNTPSFVRAIRSAVTRHSRWRELNACSRSGSEYTSDPAHAFA